MGGVDTAIAEIEAAFAIGAARPSNADLLHPECRDDMDLQRLYEVADRRDLTEADVISEYAALAFLSADGFRHFIPAYLIWVLRHPDAGEAVVDSTVWAFVPDLYDETLGPFVRSKWASLNDDQRHAIGAFLRAMAPHHPDAAKVAADGEWS